LPDAQLKQWALAPRLRHQGLERTQERYSFPLDPLPT
jgi:hypothetical protein